jgi:DNA-binding NarL/FixJ family response regulator
LVYQLEKVQQHQPDVVVMDVRMPELDGLAATRQMADLSLPARVILISSYREIDILPAVIKAGAHGFVCKDDLIELLPLAIERVGNGGLFWCAWGLARERRF